MPRQPRLVIPGHPHHVVQRGARGHKVFFGSEDYLAYRRLLAERCAASGCAVWGYCLMPNHVHLILVPETVDGLRTALSPAHRAYSLRINRRQGWRGHLWQERFHSFVMDEPHLLAAARYVERNPVRAGLARDAGDWPWSSAHAHLAGTDDDLVQVAPLLALVADWRDYLSDDRDGDTLARIREHVGSGWPLGSAAFVARLEAVAGRRLRPTRRRPRPAGDARARDRAFGEVLR